MNNPIQIQFRISPDSRRPTVGVVDVVIANKTLATLEDYPVQQLADRLAGREGRGNRKEEQDWN